MLRTALAAFACLAAASPLVASAEPRSDLVAAIAAAKDGRCHEALALTRTIAAADRAFYAAHVPAEPHLAACRASITKEARRSATRPARALRDEDEGTGTAGMIAGATGAGALAWIAGGYLGYTLERSGVLDGGDDDESAGEGVILGATAATVATSAAVVYFSGRDSRHDDSIVTTAFGAVGAGLLGTAFAMPLMADGAWFLGIATVAGTTAVGATLGFHLGRTTKQRGLEIVPAASAGFTGAVLGGTF